MATFPTASFRNHQPTVEPNLQFTGGNRTYLVRDSMGYPRFSAKIDLGKCGVVTSGSVVIRIYNQANALQETIDDAGTAPALENAGGDVYGSVTSYGPVFQFYINNWNSLAIAAGWYATLEYKDSCGNTKNIRMIDFYTGYADDMDIVTPSGVASYRGIVCPFDLCGDCQPQLWVSSPDSGVMMMLGYFSSPTGGFVLTATELYPGNSFEVSYTASPNNSNGVSTGEVSVWVSGSASTDTYGLPAGTRMEVRACDSVYKLNDCAQCCTYTSGDESGGSDVATWLAASTSPFTITSLVIGGYNVIPTGGFAGTVAITDAATLADALTELGYGTWTVSGNNVVSPTLTPLVFESITLSDSDTPAVTAEFPFASSCA